MSSDPKTTEVLELVGLAVEWRGSSGNQEFSLHKDTEKANQAAVLHKGILHGCYIKRHVPTDKGSTNE